MRNAVYENAQARERTQVLMDLANQTEGLVIGTGDLSELALGWATYNGDQMSMYGVNAAIPKTLVRYLVQYEAEHAESMALRRCCRISTKRRSAAELLPADKGENAQKTEDLVGPYGLAPQFFPILHDEMGLFPPQKDFSHGGKRRLKRSMRRRRFCIGSAVFTAGFSPSSLSAPPCRMDPRWARCRCLRGEIGACPATPALPAGSVSWMIWQGKGCHATKRTPCANRSGLSE